MENQQNANAVMAQDANKAKTTFQVAGQDVTLSYDIVRKFLTRGDGELTDSDITQFISICKYNQLNPFLNEAFLVKFKGSTAQMIVSKEAFMKRAEASEHYEGFQGGVIIERNGEYIETEGSFYLPTDKLLGAWCKVYRDDRKWPVVSRVRLSEYSTGKSTWANKPGTMITKVAKVQALREAFPAQLGAMYVQEESDVKDVPYEDVTAKVAGEIAQNANKGTLSFEPEAEQPEAEPEPVAAAKPTPEPAPKQQRVPGF